jgi:hypothetical protein
MFLGVTGVQLVLWSCGVRLEIFGSCSDFDEPIEAPGTLRPVTKEASLSLNLRDLGRTLSGLTRNELSILAAIGRTSRSRDEIEASLRSLDYAMTASDLESELDSLLRKGLLTVDSTYGELRFRRTDVGEFSSSILTGTHD